MTEQETVLLIETEQRCKSNTHRIDNLEGELKEIQSEQKAIYKIATSVELIAQRVSNIEGKVDDTNRNQGIDTAYYKNDWHCTAPICEIVCCDFAGTDTSAA